MKETEAARAVLLEVLNALGAMRDDLVIVGGWVPDLLYPSSNHMGSLDVDLAVSPKAIGGIPLDQCGLVEQLQLLGKTQCNFNVRHTKMRLSFSDGSMRFEPHLPHVLLTWWPTDLFPAKLIAG